jgi:hypothetical protein
MKILLMAALFLASVMAMSTTVSTPAYAVYWCNDGTQVTYPKSCNFGGHGGCCQTGYIHPRGAKVVDTKQRAVPVEAQGRNK